MQRQKQKILLKIGQLKIRMVPIEHTAQYGI